MPNILLIHTDDSGRYIQPYGHNVNTPNLQSVAEAGIRFRQACAAGPTCSPSRAALMTGQSPHVNGMLGLAQPGGFTLNRPERHLASYLSENGYETILAGEQHEISEEERSRHELAREVLGYDRTLDGNYEVVEGRELDGNSVTPVDLANAAAVRDFLADRDPGGEDFFLSLGLYNTHQPLPLDQKTVDSAGVLPPAPLPDVAPVREEMAAYHVLIQYVDECVGMAVDGLRAGGHLDDTLIVFTTDHGLPLPYMKANLREGGIGVSLVMRFPDGRRAGEAEDAIVSTMDLYPTFCEFAGVEVPD